MHKHTLCYYIYDKGILGDMCSENVYMQNRGVDAKWQTQYSQHAPRLNFLFFKAKRKEQSTFISFNCQSEILMFDLDACLKKQTFQKQVILDVFFCTVLYDFMFI